MPFPQRDPTSVAVALAKLRFRSLSIVEEQARKPAIAPRRNTLPAFAPIGKAASRELPVVPWTSRLSPSRYRRADIPASARTRARVQSMASAGTQQASGKLDYAESPVVRIADSHQSAKARAYQTIVANATFGSVTVARSQSAV